MTSIPLYTTLHTYFSFSTIRHGCVSMSILLGACDILGGWMEGVRE